MGSRLFVLADADSFYASCERVFHPQLMHRPIVVLSNNDGCVVSRSREAKQLGISNGLPWFKIRGQAEHDGVIARSSNYELYASLSRRMMRLMASILPDQEIYSIDECFLRGFQDRQRTRIACRLMRETVLRGIGIPLTVTTAPTRTLAKIVSHYVKHQGGGIGDWDELLSFHVPFRPAFLFSAAASSHTCPAYANAHGTELLVGLVEYLADAIVTFGIHAFQRVEYSLAGESCEYDAGTNVPGVRIYHPGERGDRRPGDGVRIAGWVGEDDAVISII